MKLFMLSLLSIFVLLGCAKQDSFDLLFDKSEKWTPINSIEETRQ